MGVWDGICVGVSVGVSEGVKVGVSVAVGEFVGNGDGDDVDGIVACGSFEFDEQLKSKVMTKNNNVNDFTRQYRFGIMNFLTTFNSLTTKFFCT